MAELKVVLVSMPWKSLESPTLPIGLLRKACRDSGRRTPDTYHGNLRWAEHLLNVSGGAISTRDYAYVANEGISHDLGDWVFTGVLHGGDFGRVEFERYLAGRTARIGRAVEMRAHAEEFIALAAHEVLAGDPDVVGFSTTFMQNVPSLALAARIKRERPEVRVVFGGGNCDGPMGAALHRNFPVVDYVVRGEGEAVFPALLDVIEAGATPDGLPGVCWWRGEVSVANPDRRSPLPPGRIPVPDYDDWFDHLLGSPVEGRVDPRLMLESSRGCWWGEKHQCTFCGLNGSLIQFRSKPAEQFVAELTDLVRRHRCLDVTMVDNIIDSRYFAEVLPELAKLDWDLRIHYEVKSNLTSRQIEQLVGAHVTHVQPGIESLSSTVLRLMDKGVHAVRNVRTLRDGQSHHLTVSWNYLYGFPRETADDYLPVIRQFPALVHLPPPSGASLICLHRFSPNFDRPDIGFVNRRPAGYYDHVYDLPEHELADLCYEFDSDRLGIGPEVATELAHGIADWKARHDGSTLLRVDLPERLVLQDRRVGWPERDHVIDDPAWRTAYDLLGPGRSLPAVHDRLVTAGHRLDASALHGWAEELVEQGLLFREGGRYLSLATTDIPVRVT
ncbi:MAG TPA: RiPP maturation radical SAM C-methyltransferase [Pseudonocardiaceae bacterium]